MSMHLKTAFYVVLISVLSGCQSYDFSVNDRVVYTPLPLFEDYTIADTALDSCVKQAISNQKVTSESQLSTLKCTSASVSTLQGLELFTGIHVLDLSSNNIVDITPLAAISSLVSLKLNGNKVIDTTPLLELPALESLELRDNPEMLCPGDTALMTLETLHLPEHC